MKKRCFKCGAEKELLEFYRHNAMSDGHLGKCKECTKADTIRNRHTNLSYYQEYDRKRSNLPQRVFARKIYAEIAKTCEEKKKRNSQLRKAWCDRNILKRKANVSVGNAIRTGILRRLSCEICGKIKTQAHHDDYGKPLEVRWMCVTHHAEHHKLMREAKRA